MPSQLSGRPIIFGEVLFDQFEDDTAVLGGAPFNVAWHLQGFGLNPIFVSRIGNDPLGEKVLASMQEWGMDTKGVQIDNDHPTGTVQVALNQGQPTFDILPDQAYDQINYELVKKLPEEKYSLLYHGSLITRSSKSRTTLFNIITEKDLPVFVDINLRPPWSEPEIVKQSLQSSRWGKLNEHELASVLNKASIPDQEIEACARQLCIEMELELLIITLGEKGAYFITAHHTMIESPPQVINLVDTVGAGDAFSAVTILGLLKNWSYDIILKHALEFSSSICGIRGATSTNADLYATN